PSLRLLPHRPRPPHPAGTAQPACSEPTPSSVQPITGEDTGHMSSRIYLCVYVCEYECVCMWMCVCVCVCVSMNVCGCVCVCIHVFEYECLCVCLLWLSRRG